MSHNHTVHSLHCFFLVPYFVHDFRLPPQCTHDVLCWDITQHIVVIPYWHFRTTYWSHFQRSKYPSFLALEDGTSTLSWNTGKELPLYTAQYPRRARSLPHLLLCTEERIVWGCNCPLLYCNLTVFLCNHINLHSPNSMPSCWTILFIVSWFFDMFWPDLIGHPQNPVWHMQCSFQLIY